MMVDIESLERFLRSYDIIIDGKLALKIYNVVKMWKDFHRKERKGDYKF